jgi:enterochelin esterase family protein
LRFAQTYGLQTLRSASAIAGMSMEGFGAFELPMRHPDLYGFSFALSGYYNDDFIAALPHESKLPMQPRILCGSDDALVDTNRRLVRALKVRQLDFYYREDSGGHTWHCWSDHMVEMLTAVNSYFTASRDGVASRWLRALP